MLAPQDGFVADLKLTVTETAGIPRSREFCQTGVPLPPGRLRPGQAALLLDDTGAPHPASFAPQGRFPDGSVRALAVGFCAEVPAFATRVWTVRCPVDDAHATPRQPLLREHPDQWVIDTGVARFEVARHAPGLLSQVQVQDAPRLRTPMDLWLRDASGQTHRLAEGTLRSATVVRHDALCVVLRQEGTHADGFFDFELSLTFLAQQARCRISYGFVNRLPPPVEAPDWRRPETVTIPIHQLRLTVPLAWEPDAMVRFNTERGARPRGWGYVLSAGDADVNAQPAAPASAHACDPQGQPVSRPSTGHQGLVATAGLALVVSQFEENFPKALATDDAGVQVDLIPRQSPVPIAIGAGRTHHLWLDFLADPHQREQLLALVAQASSPLTVHPLDAAPPATFGPLFAYQPRKYPLLETYFNDLLKRGLEARHLGMPLGGRGLLHHGDQINLNFSLNRGLRWAYANNRWDLLQALSLYALRTGDPAAHAQLRAAAEHVMDVDQCRGAFHHADLGGIHGVEAANHAFNQPETFQLWAEGLLDYWLLTGDERGLAAARLAGDFAGRAGRDDCRWSHNVRGTGIPLMLLARLYELTGEPQWRDAAEPFVLELLDTQEHDGAWRERRTPKASRALAAPWKHAIALTGLGRYIRAAHRPDLDPHFIRAARWLIDRGTLPTGIFYYYDTPTLSCSFAHGVCLEPLGDAYEKTGDRQFLEVGRLNLRYLLTQRDQFDNAAGQRDAGYVSFAAQLRGCLRLLHFLDQQHMLEDLR